jgi:hypothetical protein
MTIEYAREKLAQAERAFATGSGRMQERLEYAALFLIRIKPYEDFPDYDLRYIFNGIMADLTYKEPQGDEDRTRDIARRIVDFYHRIDRLVRGD